jgi:subtilisin family serine protease
MDAWLRTCWHHLWIGLAILLVAPAVASAAASDPLLPRQWALADPAAIGAREAWSQSDGSGVVVAVLDSGVQLDHPDLASNIWTNPREIPGNGHDDDDNGIVDDVHGASMIRMNADVDDDNGHGTHVAGIVAARRDNGIGGSGVAPGASIMAVKVLDSEMRGTTDALARGIRYAVDNGAKILNVSLNTDTATEAVRSATEYASARGAIIVASAGNAGRDIDLLPSYPAALPEVLSIAAQTDQGILSSITNLGRRSVDLAAPGESILSTATGSGYQSRTGTSAAAPFVAGSLALLSAVAPDTSMTELRDAITATTQRSGLLAGVLKSGGSLDVGAAMHRVVGSGWRSVSTSPKLKLSSRRRVRAGSRAAVRWIRTDTADVTRWRISLDGRVVKRSMKASRTRYSKRIRRVGRHKWRVVGFDGNGRKIVTANRSFRIVRR